MDVIVLPRQAGKTTELVEWVRGGASTRLYPFWTRVIVTVNETEAQRLRQTYDLEYRQVFSLRDWQGGRIRAECEVGIDNADWMLQRMLNHGLLTKVTFTEPDV